MLFRRPFQLLPSFLFSFFFFLKSSFASSFFSFFMLFLSFSFLASFFLFLCFFVSFLFFIFFLQTCDPFFPDVSFSEAILQLMAAAVAGRALHYYTFGCVCSHLQRRLHTATHSDTGTRTHVLMSFVGDQWMLCTAVRVSYSLCVLHCVCGAVYVTLGESGDQWMLCTAVRVSYSLCVLHCVCGAVSVTLGESEVQL